MKRNELERKQAEAAKLREEREERDRERRKAAADKAAKDAAHKWAVQSKRLQVSVKDMINEYDDGEPPEELGLYLRKSSSQPQIVTMLGGDGEASW